MKPEDQSTKLGDYYHVGQWVEMTHHDKATGVEKDFRAEVLSVDEELGKVVLRTEDCQIITLGRLKLN